MYMYIIEQAVLYVHVSTLAKMYIVLEAITS